MTPHEEAQYWLAKQNRVQQEAQELLNLAAQYKVRYKAALQIALQEEAFA